jgi:hypothetical protein
MVEGGKRVNGLVGLISCKRDRIPRLLKMTDWTLISRQCNQLS